MNRFKRFLRYNFSNSRKIRMYLGGYWEYWEFTDNFGNMWLRVSEENAFNRDYKFGLGKGTPICEYYDILFFGDKSELNDKVLKRLDRKRKLKRVRDEN